MGFLSTRTTQFAYFDRALGRPRWRGRRILDFGGNRGGFLDGAGDRVDPGDYWCLDVVREAIEVGQRRHPGARFVHWNRYSPEFNSGGTRHLPLPELEGARFDYLLAFSVFTHIHRKEMLELVAELERRRAPGGVLAFTFTDPGHDTGLETLPEGLYLRKLLRLHRLDYPEIDAEAVVETARRARWCVLLGDRLHVEPGDELSQQEPGVAVDEPYYAYYSAAYMAELFPRARIVPPTGQEWQHCVVLGD